MFYHFSYRLFSVLSSQPSLWEELWDYFNDKYFTPQYGDYQHINLGSGSMFSLQTIVIGFIVGAILASASYIFNKRVLGDFVRALLSVDAHSPEQARTLEQLGYLKNTTIRSALKRGTSLRRVVKCVEEEAYLAEQQQKQLQFEAENTDPKVKFKEIPFAMNPSTVHFYIPEELRYAADIKFEKKGTNWLVFVGVIIGAVAVGLMAIWMLPELLQLADNFIGIFAG